MTEAIAIADFPQLRQLCWQRGNDAVLTDADAAAIYRRNWRHVDEAALTASERALIGRLVRDHRGGVPVVPLDPTGRPIPGGAAPQCSFRVRVRDWPLLQALLRNQDNRSEAGGVEDVVLDGSAALAVYERDRGRMSALAHDDPERALIDALVTWYGDAAAPDGGED